MEKGYCRRKDVSTRQLNETVISTSVSVVQSEINMCRITVNFIRCSSFGFFDEHLKVCCVYGTEFNWVVEL